MEFVGNQTLHLKERYMDAYGYNKPGIKPLLMITKPKEQNKNQNQQMQRDGWYLQLGS